MNMLKTSHSNLPISLCLMQNWSRFRSLQPFKKQMLLFSNCESQSWFSFLQYWILLSDCFKSLFSAEFRYMFRKPSLLDWKLFCLITPLSWRHNNSQLKQQTYRSDQSASQSTSFINLWSNWSSWIVGTIQPFGWLKMTDHAALDQRFPLVNLLNTIKSINSSHHWSID